MERIEWNSSLEVGIGLLDAQHIVLVKAINALGMAVEEGRDRDVLTDVMGQLKLYTSNHFNCEERLLRLHGYPEYDEHRSEHEEFIERIEDFALDIRTGVKGVSAELHTYLRGWFLQHVHESDMRYAKFLKAKGEK